MTFDEALKNTILTEKTILEQVDEYTLYCYYTGIDPLVPGKAYNAPYYRKDNCPSFSIFHSKSASVEYLWKDHATGESGSIFKLIQKIEQLASSNDVLARINIDFALGFDTNVPAIKEKIVWYEKPLQTDIKIKIIPQSLTEKGIMYWQQFRISTELLKFYQTEQVSYFWSYVGQPAPTTAVDPTFAYRIGEFYQLYSPFAPKVYKFRNDYPENYFFGYLQLPKTGDKLVIDKSCKDVIFCKSLGFNAVCGKSETTNIPEKKIHELHERFSTTYLTLDNDQAGRRQAQKYIEQFPWMIVKFLDLAKDKTDLVKVVGYEEAVKCIRTLLE